MTRKPDRLLSLSRRLTLFSAIAALLAACLISPATVRAFDGSLELLQTGWDGTVAAGSWNPVKVRVTGGGADTTARLEVVLKSRFQPNPQIPAVDYPTGAYGQEVALPAGVAKEITLWVPADGDMVGPGSLLGTIRLMAGDRLLAEQAIASMRGPRTPYGPLVGALAESPAIARSLSQVELPVQGLPVALSVARLTASDIPVASERLRALGALVVQGNAASTLTGEQRRAVREWVASGGHLILAGGAEATRTVAVLPPDTLPVTFERSDAAADLSALARWAGAKGAEPGSGPAAHFSSSAGSPLAGATDRPLAWRWSLGQGTVTLFAADPSLEPLASWTGGPALLRKALEPALPDPNENEKMVYIRQMERDSLMRMQGAVEAMPPEAFPSWWVVALLLGGFALVVGPLLHLLLWKRDRRGWVWVAVPATALLLSAALYYTGIGRGGRDVLANVVAHVQLDPAGSQSRASVMAGFFAPTHPSLDVEVPGDVPVRVVSRFATPYGSIGMPAAPSPDSEPPFRVLSGRNTQVQFDSGQWAMRTVALVRDLGQEAGKITASLALESGLIKGTLRNDTPYPLEDAAVLIGQSLVKLGDLAPGQGVPVVLDPGRPADPFRGGFPLSYRLFGQPVGDPGAGGPSRAVAVAVSAVSSSGIGVTMPAMPGGAPERYELPQDPEVHRRVRLMDPIVNVPRPGPGMPSMPLTFIAFTRVPVSQGLPGVGDHPVYHLALLEQRLQLEFPPGPFTIPASLIPAEVTSQSGGYGGGSNGTISWVDLQGGSMTCEFKLPLPARARVEAVTVTTQQMGPTTAVTQGGRGKPPMSMTPTPAEPGVFSAYNWQSAAWDPLPGGQESARLTPASPYVGSDGIVRVQVTAGVDRAVQFIMPELTVEGTVAQ